MRSPYSSTSRSIERGAQRGAARPRPQSASIACSCVSTARTGSSVSKPATRLMKSSPSNPTARLRYQGEKRAPGNSRASSATARARLRSGATLLPAATKTSGTVSGPAGGGGGAGREVGARALDHHPDVTRVADGAGLVEGDTHPGDGELRENEQRHAVRESLDQLELGSFDERHHPLGHLLVVECVGDLVADRRVPAVHRQLDVEHHGLLDAALPVDEADDALGGQAVQEDPVIGLGDASHGGSAGSDSSGQRARAWMARPSCSPACRRANPATAIIAALSVENSMRG